jgi:hypothetical protein
MKTILYFILFLSPYFFSAQGNLVALLKSKKWIVHYNFLVDSVSVSDKVSDSKSQRDYRNQFEFLDNGKIKYRDLLTDYDPHREGGCSNSFANYSGMWTIKNKRVYLELEYNTISEKRFLVEKYLLQNEGNDVHMIAVENIPR